MYYTYVLYSLRDGRWYTGATSNLRERAPYPCGTGRVREHETGRVRSTRHRRPFQLVYYEACLSEMDARRRERYLKTGRGKRYIRQRLQAWLEGISLDKLERH